MRKAIENLIHYEITQKVILDRDVNYIRNQLYHLLKLEMTSELPKPSSIEHPSDALEMILDELEEANILDGSKVSRDLMDAKIMNVFAKLPSDVERTFFRHYQKNPTAATDWYYNYMQALNYIRMDRILKNQSFTSKTDYGTLDITINMSKPEKDPKSIILASQTTSTAYPKCLLCAENEGFSGNFTRDSRDQHRMIKFNLGKDTYFFQYSPYIYYNEHAIVLSEIHRPMVINKQTFENLLTLCDMFEGYFFGSNADLPIVGGSILSHDHYQGGKHEFPIERAEILKTWEKGQITYQLLKWPLSTIRLISQSKDKLIHQATHILNQWKNYEHKELFLFPKTGDTPHQTITPVSRKKNGYYELDLILRNNYTNEAYPLGLYHPHEDKWNIKKENIGLIEAMGLAILPARLKKELEEVKNYLLNDTPLSASSVIHQNWANAIKMKTTVTKENVDDIIKHEIGIVFEHVLEDCGVFKQDEKGLTAFQSFIEGLLL